MRKTKNHWTGARIIEVGILIVLPILCHIIFPVKILISKPYSYVGIILMSLGLYLTIWSARLFRERGRGFQLQTDYPVLVTSGPFRFSRNPIYLGMLAWLIGLAAFLGSLIAFLFPVIFFVLVNFIIIPFEERSMGKLFGVKYTNYKQSVRRWI